MGVTKYIFVTGGVLSGVGKGITAASIGAVLQAKGASVSIQKCDPYLNTDAGRLDPVEHGEVFVTADGAETDLDLGHYERFLDIEMSRRNSTLSGRLMLDLIQKEQRGEFGGKTVQLVPHLTGAIQDEIEAAGEGSDVHIVEIGGTVGDYEGLSFIEAIRELAWKSGRENCLFLHVVYVPFIGTSKEFKTKPAQNALNDLRGFGIVPDAVIVRSDDPAPESVRKKIALFGGLQETSVQLMPNVDTVFRIPELLSQNGIHDLLSKFTGLDNEPDLSKWRQVIARQTDTSAPVIKAGLVVSYLENNDAYLSVTEALKAAAWSIGKQVDINWIDVTKLDERRLNEVDMIVAPGGEGLNGDDGFAQAAKYALENKIPYLGINLGFEAAVKAATDKDLFNKTEACIGKKESKLTPSSIMAKYYGGEVANERHRHKNQLSVDKKDQLEAAGLSVSGISADGKQIEFIEAKNHPFFVATIANIEYTSRPYRAHPLFIGLLNAG